MIQSDWQDILVNFVYTNLPALMNPASNITIVSTTSLPILPDANTIVITPEILLGLQAYVLNNFDDLRLPSDIQDIVREFFSVNLPEDSNQGVVL
ncbi:hypothetical protein [Sporomusa sp.]|jgi:hypothetical protein|uniref:hypothetical protein n=1 Tax=Sporomusa sp. TaxID=2078658 RepID=UPI002BA4A786|nr:hypothetical protein [Sporomusa sp.]MDF2874031.1 hypothetical protein [Sporomusa sp.]HWR08380.1 hypothetical protein [Sporomusa sp.]